MPKLAAVVCATLIVAARAPAPAAQSAADAATLREVLLRAGQYVDAYDRAFSAVVSKEHYVQRVRQSAAQQARELRSDVAVVSVGDAGWVAFRDVYEVDGRPLRDREERLVALFMRPPPDLGAQARRLSEESARYNLGPVTRTINTPTLALLVLRPENQARSTFALSGTRRIDGHATREVRFGETARPRFVVTQDDAAAHGRFWIVPETGAVLRSEFNLQSAGNTAEITVTYKMQPTLAMFVPASMVESYETQFATSATPGRRASAVRVSIEGNATYSDFRRFQIDTSVVIR